MLVAVLNHQEDTADFKRIYYFLSGGFKAHITRFHQSMASTFLTVMS
jgi:hypothetical protein